MEKRLYLASSSSSKSKSIPPDLIFDIFTRLPFKSLIRFRCVSKRCYSIVPNPSFVNLHAIRFPFKPLGLLITCPTTLQTGQRFFSVDFNGGAAVDLLTIPPRFSRYSTHSVNGLVCMDFGICATICNPSMRQSVDVPLICSLNSPLVNSTYYCVNSFGFDPISKQYKVLNSWGIPGRETEYRVFTLGTNSWRLVSGGPPCYPQRQSICVDGIVYLRSCTFMCSENGNVLVAFDLQTESFSVITLPERAPEDGRKSDLIVFRGRPGLVSYRIDNITPQEEQNYIVVGTVPSGEILLVPKILSSHLFVVYYDTEKNCSRKVIISGLPEYRQNDLFSNIVSFTNYEENILSFR
ncbi:F-box protein At5g62510-like [Mangifera indica]|uniref:F-box protein At5g62510-like n=1 Tax=Mangifera indica TaxID=29780 RepID=UPI001CFA8062|nr:F-box protein At5g62510-like [Mangifera indica]